MELYLCPFCKKKKAWASSTYPYLVVHNCQGSLVEVGSLFFTYETSSSGKVTKHKEYQPLNQTKTTAKLKLFTIDSVDSLKDCFTELQLSSVSYFSGQPHYRNFPFWDKLWEYRSYKILDEKDQLKYIILLDHEFNFRQNATACMGLKGRKPDLLEAKEIIRTCQQKGIPVKDESLAIRYITKSFD